MSEHTTLMLVWHALGDTQVIDMVDHGGNITFLVKAFVDALPAPIKENANVAIMRGVIADQQGLIADLRVQLQAEAAKVQQLTIDNNYLNGLAYTVPVKEGAS